MPLPIVGEAVSVGYVGSLANQAVAEVIATSYAEAPFTGVEEREYLRLAILRRCRLHGFAVTTQARGVKGVVRVRRDDGRTWAEYDGV